MYRTKLLMLISLPLIAIGASEGRSDLSTPPLGASAIPLDDLQSQVSNENDSGPAWDVGLAVVCARRSMEFFKGDNAPIPDGEIEWKTEEEARWKGMSALVACRRWR